MRNAIHMMPNSGVAIAKIQAFTLETNSANVSVFAILIALARIAVFLGIRIAVHHAELIDRDGEEKLLDYIEGHNCRS